MLLFDTLSAEKSEFSPLKEKVSMYVCGPNLYGPSHIGHALSYIVFDVLRRYLEYQGYSVVHVQNFTDIEDRIIEVAKRDGSTIEELSSHYIERFLDEMDSFGIQRAHYYPRATEYIEQMIDIIGSLIEKGQAYDVDGDVYFRVNKFSGYGSLSKRTTSEMKSGTRVDVDERKEDPMDFALWKSYKEGEPYWPSPWGNGRPGWHIECSAMSLSILGDRVDIHGGGQDVIFPHHENEIAQSEAYTNASPFVNFWVHNGLLRLREEDESKMTRHEGNFVSSQETLANYNSDAIRMFLLSSHYRNPLAYSLEGLTAAEKALDRLISSLRENSGGNETGIVTEPYSKRFFDAMDDDLNTPQAIAVLFDLAREINRNRNSGVSLTEAQECMRELGSILGLQFIKKSINGLSDGLSDDLVDILVETRGKLRASKNWALADEIRSRLEEKGIIVEDSSDGSSWHFGS